MNYEIQNTWFDIFQTLKRFVFHILQEEYADINRIYVMGVINIKRGYLVKDILFLFVKNIRFLKAAHVGAV